MGVTNAGAFRGFGVNGLSPPAAEMPRSHPLDLSPVPVDRFVQLLVVAVLDQVREDLQNPACAAVESQLNVGHLALAQGSRDCRSLIDCPEAP